MKKFEDFFGIIKTIFYISAFGTLVSKGRLEDIFSIVLVVSTVLCLAGFAVYGIMLKAEEKKSEPSKGKVEVVNFRKD